MEKAAGELVPEETSAHLRSQLPRTVSRGSRGSGDVVRAESSLDTTRLSSQPSTVQLATRVEHLSLNAYSG